MFIDKDSLIVNGLNLGPFILEAKFGFNKLWASDTGRNLAGTYSGTLIGIFPKIIVQFKKLTQSEAEQIVPILDSSTQSVKYYDPNKKQKITISTYTGDYEIINKNIIDEITKCEGFSISFISRKKRN